MEPSLDDRIKLSDVYNSKKQEDSQLQIYVLAPKLFADGTINPDSTGLIAFADRAGNAKSCLHCGADFMGPDGAPIEGAVKTIERFVMDKNGEEIEIKDRYCAKCNNNILFVKIDNVTELLKEKKDEIVELLLEGENIVRKRKGQQPAGAQWVEDKKREIPLMIKADRNTYYGRILQVVQKAKAAKIFNFAFVSSPESNKEAFDEPEESK